MDLSKPLVLLDLSSYVFYRNFALHRWMATAKIDKESFSREAFLEKFCKLFEDNLVTFRKKLKVPFSNFILARDCPRDSIWRMEVFPQYKQSRPKQIPNFDPQVFVHTYNVLLPTLITKYGFHVLQYDRAEGDDIIAVATKKLDGIMPHVYIMSCDNDFLQLQSVSVSVLDFQLKALAKGAVLSVLDVFLKWKVIFGDESDNIPSIDKKVGRVTAEKWARDSSILEEKLKDKVILSNYNRNNLLINFDMLPIPLQTGISKCIDAILKQRA